MQEVTIKDIARICGVGVSTVSRAINNHPDINEATKKQVMETIARYNYVPNNSARNLKRQESRTIAVLIKGISNPFFQSMIKVFEKEIQRKKYIFFLHQVDARDDEVEIALELIKEKRLKGIIFLGGSFHHSEEKLRQISVPFVLSTTTMAEATDKSIYSSVSVDNVKESRKMTEYLLTAGHEKIALLTSDPEDQSIGCLREQGYREALKSRGIEADPELICYSKVHSGDSYSMKNGYEMMQALLQSGKEFTAVYAISDSMAIGAAKALLEAGRRIPQDCSLAGFDGLDITYYFHPSITTLQQPVQEMAEETTRILFRMIRGGSAGEHKILAGTLLKRASVS